MTARSKQISTTMPSCFIKDADKLRNWPGMEWGCIHTALHLTRICGYREQFSDTRQMRCEMRMHLGSRYLVDCWALQVKKAKPYRHAKSESDPLWESRPDCSLRTLLLEIVISHRSNWKLQIFAPSLVEQIDSHWVDQILSFYCKDLYSYRH